MVAVDRRTGITIGRLAGASSAGSCCDQAESHHALIPSFEHDFRANASRVCRGGKPVFTVPNHALGWRRAALSRLKLRGGAKWIANYT